MCKCVVNVQMCECANVQIVAFVRAFTNAFNHLQIRSASPLHAE